MVDTLSNRLSDARIAGSTILDIKILVTCTGKAIYAHWLHTEVKHKDTSTTINTAFSGKGKKNDND